MPNNKNNSKKVRSRIERHYFSQCRGASEKEKIGAAIVEQKFLFEVAVDFDERVVGIVQAKFEILEELIFVG